MRFLLPLLACTTTLSCQATRAASPAPISGPVADRARAILSRDAQRLIDFRHDLHRHPELSGDERRTAEAVAAELRRHGLEVQTGVGGHGVVARVRGARPGPHIAYRADMDAVASSAADPVEYRSLNAGIRHICGHDLHTTIGVALATIMQSLRDSLAGRVTFVFQPAEERATGAQAMLAAGVFGNDTPVAIYGVHTAPYETGVLATTAGPMMGGRDQVEAVLTGAGDLTSAVNTVAAALLGVATVRPDAVFQNQPVDFIAVQLGAPQVTSGRATIQGTVSVASAASRARMQRFVSDSLARLVPGVAVTATYRPKWVAGVTNDTVLTTRAGIAVRSTLGDAALRTVTGIVPAFSEDFGAFQERMPGTFFFLGVSNASRGWTGMPHTPDYVADDRAIEVGATAMSAVLLDRLKQE